MAWIWIKSNVCAKFILFVVWMLVFSLLCDYCVRIIHIFLDCVKRYKYKITFVTKGYSTFSVQQMSVTDELFKIYFLSLNICILQCSFGLNWHACFAVTSEVSIHLSIHVSIHPPVSDWLTYLSLASRHTMKQQVKHFSQSSAYTFLCHHLDV